MLLAAALLLAPALADPVDVRVDAELGRDDGDGSRARPLSLEGIKKWLIANPEKRPARFRMKGTFRLKETWRLGPEANQARFYGPCVISGGTEVPLAGDLAPVGDARPDQLWVDDRRATRPVLPKTGFYRFAGWPTKEEADVPWNTGQSRALYSGTDLAPDLAGSDAEIVVHHFWVTSRLGIKSVDAATRTVEFDRKTIWKLANDWDPGYATYRVENPPGALPDPGEFVLDRAARAVRIVPLKGERPKAATYPRLTTLVSLEGATDVDWHQITFSHSERGLGKDSAGSYQGGFGLPAAFDVVDSRQVGFDRCEFRHLGAWGMEFKGPKSRANLLIGCRFEDVGAGGVKLSDGTAGNELSDNTVDGFGRVHAGSAAILVGLSGANRILHNRIVDGFYTGISVGWDWGFKDTAARDNLVANNEIGRIGQGMLSDMGGVYTLGNQPGTVIRANWIHDVAGRAYGGWGIYLDEGSTGILVEDNVVTRTTSGGFHIHYGKDNVVRHNAFSFALKEGQIIRQRDDQQGPIRFESNVIVGGPRYAPLVPTNWLRRDVVLAGNVYWPSGERPFGDDGTGRFEDPLLDPNGVPTARLRRITPLRLDVGPRPGASFE